MSPETKAAITYDANDIRSAAHEMRVACDSLIQNADRLAADGQIGQPEYREEAAAIRLMVSRAIEGLRITVKTGP